MHRLIVKRPLKIVLPSPVPLNSVAFLFKSKQQALLSIVTLREWEGKIATEKMVFYKIYFSFIHTTRYVKPGTHYFATRKPKA